MTAMVRLAVMAVLLFGLWLVLSGYTKPLLVGFGLLSVGVTVALARRMGVLDREGHPVDLLLRLFRYWVWLAWQIVTSNVDVARRILSPSLPIQPTVVRVRCGKRTDLGRVLLANSITLTPGTVTLDVSEDEIEVHALTTAAARALREGSMQRLAPERTPAPDRAGGSAP